MSREPEGVAIDPGGDAGDLIGVYLTFPDHATAAAIGGGAPYLDWVRAETEGAS